MKSKSMIRALGITLLYLTSYAGFAQPGGGMRNAVLTCDSATGLHVQIGNRVRFMGPLPETGDYIVVPVAAPSWEARPAIATPVVINGMTFYQVSIRVSSQDHQPFESHHYILSIEPAGSDSLDVNMAGGVHESTGGSHGGSAHFGQ